MNRINGQLMVSPPKTRNSIRTLAIPQQAVDLLIAEHKNYPRNPYLFPSPKTGTMYDPDAFRRTHDKISKAIGTEHIRFHDLRHAVAEKRSGRENAVRCAGPLFGRLHAEHLHPCHGANEAGRRRRHRRGHQPADAVNMAKNTGPDRKFPVWPCPVLSAPFPVWVSV